MTETRQMGTHMKELSESYPMDTNMTWFRCFFQKSLRSCALDNTSLSIGKVKFNLDCPYHIISLYIMVVTL